MLIHYSLCTVRAGVCVGGGGDIIPLVDTTVIKTLNSSNIRCKHDSKIFCSEYIGIILSRHVPVINTYYHINVVLKLIRPLDISILAMLQ